MSLTRRKLLSWLSALPVLPFLRFSATLVEDDRMTATEVLHSTHREAELTVGVLEDARDYFDEAYDPRAPLSDAFVDEFIKGIETLAEQRESRLGAILGRRV